MFKFPDFSLQGFFFQISLFSLIFPGPWEPWILVFNAPVISSYVNFGGPLSAHYSSPCSSKLGLLQIWSVSSLLINIDASRISKKANFSPVTDSSQAGQLQASYDYAVMELLFDVKWLNYGIDLSFHKLCKLDKTCMGIFQTIKTRSEYCPLKTNGYSNCLNFLYVLIKVHK